MQIKYIRCMKLPKGVPVPHFDTMKEAVTHLKGDELKGVDLLNKYGRQKDSLVNAREFVSTVVDSDPTKTVEYDGKQYKGYGFPLIDTKTKRPLSSMSDKELESAKPETDSDHLDRFALATATGKHTVTGLTPTGEKPEDRVKSVWSFLQSLIEQHGPFPFDLNQSTRVGKPRTPPKYAIDAATNIISKNNEAAWVKKFQNGYESPGYGMVEPITFSDFTQKAAKGASPEETEKVRQSNITNLAWAIDAVETQKRERSIKKEYA